jgi:hypothetical protein
VLLPLHNYVQAGADPSSLLDGALGWDDFCGNEVEILTKGKLKLVFACFGAVVFVQFKADTETNKHSAA